MIRVNTQVRPPVRVELPDGASITFKPASTPGRDVGRMAASATLVAGEPQAVAMIAFTVALARWGAIAWEGIGDEGGEPLELTPENVSLLLEQNPTIYDAVDEQYARAVLALEREKNVSAPEPDGSSPASSPKTPKARAHRGAGETTAPAARPAAESVPSSKTPRKLN